MAHKSRLHPASERLRRALERLHQGNPWTGTVFRSASPQYANRDDLLTGIGSKRNGARWNPPNSFAAVYTSLDIHTAIDEALAHFRHYHFRESDALPRVLVAIDVHLQKVLDLTDGAIRSVLRISLKRIRTEP